MSGVARISTWRPNPLIIAAAADRHVDCCQNTRCLDCGASVSTYNCNAALIAQRPEAARHDWWAACDNADCQNAWGEEEFQVSPNWAHSEGTCEYVDPGMKP